MLERETIRLSLSETSGKLFLDSLLESQIGKRAAEDASVGIDVGNMVRNCRVEKNVSHSELAARTNLTEAELDNLERGLGDPTVGRLDRVISALGDELVIATRSELEVFLNQKPQASK